MADGFMITGDIPTLHGAVPVRFAHCKSEDTLGNHVLHLNNYLECYVFVSGNHQYIVENMIYELKRGDIILIGPREVHKALPMEEGCLYERFYLLLDEHCFDGIENNPLPRIIRSLPKSSNLISPPEEEREEVLKLLYGISAVCGAETVASVGIFGTVLKLMDICLQQLSRRQPVTGTETAVPELLREILLYVAKNIATLQTTGQVAQALGISQQYLSTYFSRYIGTSLKIFIQTKKVALAKDLLEQGADVTRACFDSGFNDCSYFIKVFKKHTSLTPMQYQKKHRQKTEALQLPRQKPTAY